MVKTNPRMNSLYYSLNNVKRLHKLSPNFYNLEKIKNHALELFSNHAPFKIGEQVEIINNLVIKSNSKWAPFQDLLKQGVAGIIINVDYFPKTGFIAYVHLDSILREHPFLEKILPSTIRLVERQIKKLDEKPQLLLNDKN